MFGGTQSSWRLRWCAEAASGSEAQAAAALRRMDLDVSGANIKVSAPDFADGTACRSTLVADGPVDGGVVVHATGCFVQVFDLAGGVHVAAARARAKILDTAGEVDVTAGAIDFAGSRGTVTLNSESEINLKLDSRAFDGVLAAEARGPLRVLVPPGFSTPLEVVVGEARAFVCRLDLAGCFESRRQGSLHIFRYGVRHAGTALAFVHLRSDNMVVIDAVR